MRKIKFDAWKDERIEKAGTEIELSDGITVVIPPPELWDDNVTGKPDSEAFDSLFGEHAERARNDGVTAAALLKIVYGTDDAEEQAKSEASDGS